MKLQTEFSRGQSVDVALPEECISKRGPFCGIKQQSKRNQPSHFLFLKCEEQTAGLAIVILVMPQRQKKETGGQTGRAAKLFLWYCLHLFSFPRLCRNTPRIVLTMSRQWSISALGYIGITRYEEHAIKSIKNKRL